MGIVIGIGALIWVVCGIAAAVFAGQRNRSQAGWFVAGFLLGPVGLVMLLTLPVAPQSQVVEASPAPFVPSTRAQRLIPLVILAVLAAIFAWLALKR